MKEIFVASIVAVCGAFSPLLNPKRCESFNFLKSACLKESSFSGNDEYFIGSKVNEVPTEKEKQIFGRNYFIDNANIMAILLVSLNPLYCERALATDGYYGILESKYTGMIHPIGMFALYGLTAISAYYGFLWRRAREIGQDINLKAKIGYDTLPLEQERSNILLKKPRDNHFLLGSILLGSGILLSIFGSLTTWWRVGELFPGDHLFAGLGLTAVWAVSASLSPAMSKGADWARYIHIGLNIIGLALFTWQLLSGWEIMINVWNSVPGW